MESAAAVSSSASSGRQIGIIVDALHIYVANKTSTYLRRLRIIAGTMTFYNTSRNANRSYGRTVVGLAAEHRLLAYWCKRAATLNLLTRIWIPWKVEDSKRLVFKPISQYVGRTMVVAYSLGLFLGNGQITLAEILAEYIQTPK